MFFVESLEGAACGTRSLFQPKLEDTKLQPKSLKTLYREAFSAPGLNCPVFLKILHLSVCYAC